MTAPSWRRKCSGGVTFPLCSCSILTLSDYVTELGHPYVWVQKLGGLHFPKDQPQAWLTPSPLSSPGRRAELAGLRGGSGDASVPSCSPKTPELQPQTMGHPWLPGRVVMLPLAHSIRSLQTTR